MRRFTNSATARAVADARLGGSQASPATKSRPRLHGTNSCGNHSLAVPRCRSSSRAPVGSSSARSFVVHCVTVLREPFGPARGRGDPPRSGVSRPRGPPGRRHLRAVPPPLRAAVAPRPTTAMEVGRGPRRRRARCWRMLEEGATHVGVATDHVIESFRNDLWPGYKTSAGMRAGAAGAVPAARGRARARSA